MHVHPNTATGIGSIALASALQAELPAAPADKDPRRGSLGVVNPLHFAPKAKRVIYLFMCGGPSHIDTFDYKPKMKGMDNKTVDVKTFGRGGLIHYAYNLSRALAARGHEVTLFNRGKTNLGLFPDLETIVGKALAKQPDRRYGSVSELADDIDRYLNARPILARPPSAAYRAKKFVQRNRFGVAATAMVVAAIRNALPGEERRS